MWRMGRARALKLDVREGSRSPSPDKVVERYKRETIAAKAQAGAEHWCGQGCGWSVVLVESSARMQALSQIHYQFAKP